MNHEFQRTDRECCSSTIISTLNMPGALHVQYNCQGLTDYPEKFLEAVAHPSMHGKTLVQVEDLLCQDRATAEFFQFSGANYIINAGKDESRDFDVDSIMMYGTYVSASELCLIQLDFCPLLKYQTVGGVPDWTVPPLRFPSPRYPSDTDAAFVRKYYV